MPAFRRLFALLILALFIALAPCAAAQTALIDDRAQLYAEGCLPPPPAERPSFFGVTSIEDVLYEALSAQSTYISIGQYGLTNEEFRAIYQDFLNNRPELFFVEGRYQYAYSGSTISAIIPFYKYTGEALSQQIAAFNAAVRDVVRDAKKADTPIGRLLRAHEYFCLNFEYDESLSIYSPEEFFASGRGVCQAYMLAYRAVLNELGFTSSIATSSAMNHIWNMVYLDGEWYHIDVTWDDPTPNFPLGAMHNNFLRSDAGIRATAHHSWDAVYSAESSAYDDAFWIDLGVPLSVSGDVVSHVQYDESTLRADVYLCSLDTLESRKITSYDITGNTGSALISPLGEASCVNALRVYFAIHDKVYSVNHNGGGLRLEYIIGKNSLKIWRMTADGLTLNLFASASSMHDGQLIRAAVDAPFSVSLSPGALTMEPGSQRTLSTRLSPKPAIAPDLVYESSAPWVLSVDQSGALSAHLPGTAVITVTCSGLISTSAQVLVRCKDTLVLPQGLQDIGSEAFAHTAASQVVLPQSIKTIGSRAFASSSSLLYITLPQSIMSIAQDAFDGCPDLTLVCPQGSYAAAYAEQAGYPFVIIPADQSSGQVPAL